MNLSGNGDAIPGLDRGVVGMLKGLGTQSLTEPVMKLLLLLLLPFEQMTRHVSCTGEKGER